MLGNSNPFASLPTFGSGGTPGGPMTAGPTGFNGSLAPFSIQPAQGFGQGMFGQRRQGPFGGAMGMNPIMRLMAVLMHGQGLSPMQQGAMQAAPQYNQAFPPLPYGG